MLAVDPGHGGANEGCRANGLVEKELTLAVAQTMARLAVAANVPLTLTRTDDTTTPFARRRQRAHDAHATQVISIHFDSNSDPRVGRLTCYCQRSDDRAREIAARILQLAPVELSANKKPILVEPTGWKRRASNVVTAFAPVPTVLVECAFVTNPLHAAYLQGRGVAALGASLTAALVQTTAGNFPGRQAPQPRNT